MKTTRKKRPSIWAMSLTCLLATAWAGLALAADKYAPAPSTIKGWTEYAEPVRDLRDPAHRNPKYPWMPKGPFPFKPSWPRKDVPYTGEELLWMRDYGFWGGQTQDYAGYSPSANKRGLIVSKNFYIQRTHYWDNYDQLMNYETQGGMNGIFQKVFTILDNPPENRGFAQLTVKYNNAPGKWKDPDRYNYIPSLRRVRRSAGGDRQDDSLGYPLSNDDNGERQWWEYTYEIVAEDVLCEVGSAKGQAILGDPKVIVDSPYMPGTWGAGENPYRQDGCLEAWVVKATHKDPDYYLGYLLYWIEKRTKMELRCEQYDHYGELWRIDFETTWRLYPGGFKGGGGWGRQLLYSIDYKRDFWGLYWYMDWIFGAKIPESKYSTGELTKEFFWREPKKFRAITKFEYMPPYPPLYEEKVSKYRKGVAQIEPAVKKKMKERNDFWARHGGYDPWGWAQQTKFKDVK
ncbi:MAG: outer membrane lipoprotein-sorting protein [Nitrospinae bacterium]|nr:outer membrane lipoprotein-sorting protein [Nitrospinota bacterium]